MDKVDGVKVDVLTMAPEVRAQIARLQDRLELAKPGDVLSVGLSLANALAEAHALGARTMVLVGGTACVEVEITAALSGRPYGFVPVDLSEGGG